LYAKHYNSALYEW